MASHPVYQDHSRRGNKWLEEQIHRAKVRGSSHRGRHGSFPCKLHHMLENVERTGHSSVVRWLSHGRAFKVYNKKRFETEVMPMYFQSQGTFLSFQRQLNLYGFLRLTGKGPDQNAYYNELFLRQRPKLSMLLVRKGASNARVRRSFDPSTEPDFYSMTPLEETDFSAHKPSHVSLPQGIGTHRDYRLCDARCTPTSASGEARDSNRLKRMISEANIGSELELAGISLNAVALDRSILADRAALDSDRFWLKQSDIVNVTANRSGWFSQEIPALSYDIDWNTAPRTRGHSNHESHVTTSQYACEGALMRSCKDMCFHLPKEDGTSTTKSQSEVLEEIHFDLCPEFVQGVDTFDWLHSIDIDAFWSNGKRKRCS